jgi:hypothetical protein
VCTWSATDAKPRDVSRNLKKKRLMNIFASILQPPNCKKFKFIVDELNDRKTYGKTNDIEKIKYNLKLLDESFNIDLKINLLLSEDGVTNIFAVGNFITILQLNNNQQQGMITFFNINVNATLPELKYHLEDIYSSNIVAEWVKLYELMINSDLNENDHIELFQL